MPSITMGIDQSLTCTGVSIIETAKDGVRTSIATHAIHTEPTMEDPVADVLVRSMRIAKELKTITEQYNPDYIALENLSYGSIGNATRNLAILFGVICTTLGLSQPSVVPPTTLKKFATGNGKATKKEMLAAIEKQDKALFDYLDAKTIKSGKYDITDAYWIARWRETK